MNGLPHHNPRFRANDGFTLIELIVTTAILAVLGVAVIVSMSGQIQSAKAQECQANMQMIEAAKHAWVSDHPGETLAAPGGGQTDPLAPYLRSNTVPQCPSGGTYTQQYDRFNRTTCSEHGLAR
jgi:prepilin-type N-terminal cleavage/methylation domain-containing protein